MRNLFLLSLLSLVLACQSSEQWKPASSPLTTPWTDQVQPEAVLPEYPRPQMIRESWQSLNGLWEYAIQPAQAHRMGEAQGKILVPFAVESALSGVGDTLALDERLWYRRQIQIPEDWDEKRIMLNFEAVDWECEVFIDGITLGTHMGGYDPFSMDATLLLQDKKPHVLTVAVYDPSDHGDQQVKEGKYFNPRGKQVRKPGGIFYTSVSGIWQSVWMEALPLSYLSRLSIKSDNLQGKLSVEAPVYAPANGQLKVLQVRAGDSLVAQQTVSFDEAFSLQVPDVRLWSPDDPFLYHLNLKLMLEDSLIDEVDSYAGFRTVDLGKDSKGYTRILVNGAFEFQNGPLDQGFWPDGIYTAPTDEALQYDLKQIKAMGFNMLRKHVKIESRRFYYHCDRLGLWVWQDMPSAQPYIQAADADLTVSPNHDFQFRRELEQMIRQHENHPSIIIWVAFNEGWGQYQSEGITQFIKRMDPSRLVITASGWSDRKTGDIYDIHHYPDPRFPALEADRASVLGEFGGLGYAIKDHMWAEENWGYQSFADSAALVTRYEGFYDQVWAFVDSGMSAAVYTQITDVETETNGLMTYDRKITKMDTALLRSINTRQYVAAPRFSGQQGLFNSPKEIALLGSGQIYYTLDGREPNEQAIQYEEPIVLEKTTTIQAVTISPSGQKSRIVSGIWEKTELSEPSYATAYSERYHAGGTFALIDGKEGSLSYGDGYWQGFSGENLDVSLDISVAAQGGKGQLNFLRSHDHWIFLPQAVSLWAYDQNGALIHQAEQPYKLAESKQENQRIAFSFDLPPGAVRLRILAHQLDAIPSWHQGAGRKAWIFVDEIIWGDQAL
ncbi:MAG: FN3 associated domain-containing protein [Bacteroidota bacterium]